MQLNLCFEIDKRGHNCSHVDNTTADCKIFKEMHRTETRGLLYLRMIQAGRRTSQFLFEKAKMG